MDRFSILTGKTYVPGTEEIPDLEDRLQEVLQKYIGGKNVFEVRRQIKNEASRVLVELLDDKDPREFPASEVRIDIKDLPEENRILVAPGNLFTLLLFHGVFVPFPEIEGIEVYTDEKKKIRYSFSEGTSRVEHFQ